MKDLPLSVDLSPIDPAPVIDGAKIARIPIGENDDPLVQVCPAHPLIRVIPHYAEQGIPGAISECYVRQGVYNRLLNAARALPSEYKLVVLDGWRPICVQQYLFDALLTSIRADYPDIDESVLLQRTVEFVSLPSSDELAPSFHLTGGAVDVTLSDENGHILDMGSPFDGATAESHTAFFESRKKLAPCERRARDNRKRLYWAMIGQGFTNLASEWWHYDFGNQLWAYQSGNKRALYGVAKPSAPGRG